MSKSVAAGLGSEALSYRADIQGLRAIAVLAVVVYHATPGLLPGGFVGVDMFFVISGFVITSMINREIDTGKSFDFKRFYARRARRLLPAMAAMLLVVLCSAAAIGPYGGVLVTARTGLAAAVFSANVYLTNSATYGYFDGGVELNALLHTWSLSVEEQFYLVFPAILVFVARRRRSSKAARRQAQMILVAAISVASLTLCITMANSARTETILGAPESVVAFYSPFTRAWEFGAGALLALSGAATARRQVRTAISAAGLAGCGLCFVTFDAGIRFPGTAALLPVASTVLLLTPLRVESGTFGGLLRSQAITWIGDRSYGLYLWHWPAIVFANALAPRNEIARFGAALLSVIPAALSYAYVENPFRLRGTSYRRTVGLAACCILVPLAAGLSVHLADRSIQGSERSGWIGQVRRAHTDAPLRCRIEETANDERCLWSAEGSAGVIVLVGDSNAGSLSEPFIEASNKLGYSMLVITRPGCPFIEVAKYTNGVLEDNCGDFVEQTIGALTHYRPVAVVVAQSTDAYIEDEAFSFQSAGETRRAKSADTKADLMASALEASLSKVNNLPGSPAVGLVHPIPKVPGWDVRACSVVWVLSAPERCASDIHKTTAREYRSRAIGAQSAAGERVGATVVDFFEILCPADLCKTYDHGIWNMKDGDHMSVSRAQLLTPNVVQVLEALVANV